MCTGDDRAGPDHRFVRIAAFDELRRRQGGQVAENRPLAVVQVEYRVHAHQVHVRVVVGIEGSDVTPVTVVALGLPGHDVAIEVVDGGHPLVGQHRDDVATHVVHRAFVAGVDLQRLDEHIGGEHVVAHRDVGLVR